MLKVDQLALDLINCGKLLFELLPAIYSLSKTKINISATQILSEFMLFRVRFEAARIPPRGQKINHKYFKMGLCKLDETFQGEKR